MKVIYDCETDSLSIILRSGKVAESDEVREGLIFDYDKSGQLISLELLDASQHVHEPASVEFARLGLKNRPVPSLLHSRPERAPLSAQANGLRPRVRAGDFVL